MRTFLAVLFIAATANAMPLVKDGQWLDTLPKTLARGDGFALLDPQEADFIAAGWVQATQEQLAARAEAAAQAAAQAEVDRQLSKPLALKKAENNFFSMCYVLFTSMDKRGFPDITAALDAMKATDPMTAMVLSIQLLGIDAEAKREGGLQWWDDAVYHPEVAP